MVSRVFFCLWIFSLTACSGVGTAIIPEARSKTVARSPGSSVFSECGGQGSLDERIINCSIERRTPDKRYVWSQVMQDSAGHRVWRMQDLDSGRAIYWSDRLEQDVPLHRALQVESNGKIEDILCRVETSWLAQSGVLAGKWHIPSVQELEWAASAQIETVLPKFANDYYWANDVWLAEREGDDPVVMSYRFFVPKRWKSASPYTMGASIACVAEE